MTQTAGSMNNACIFSDDRRYRYVLEHVFTRRATTPAVEGIVNFIMLNPSTADESQLDPTLRRCRGFADAWGYDRFVVTNIFAYRATDPRDMRAARDPVGPHNDVHLATAAIEADLVIVAWGAHGIFQSRDVQVRDLLLRTHGVPIKLFRLNSPTGAGQPRHPLYLPEDARRIAWP